MKKVLLILVDCLCFISCREDIVLPPVVNEYSVIIMNDTHDEIFFKSKHLVCSTVILASKELSEPLYGNTETAEIEYFGKGTYWKTLKKTITLQKGKTITVALKYPAE